jgi:hypothetical protein
MFATFSRSWSLVKASAAVLRSDTELLVFPLVSSVMALIVAASFVLPLGLLGGEAQALKGDELDLLAVVWLFALYFCQYLVIFFFNTALVGAAMIRLDGGDPTVADGLRIAYARLGAIVGYAAIAATVGLLLRIIEQRAGWLGKLVSGLLGVAWTFASYLVVPVLVTQNVGPLQAVKESAGLLRKTWGENLVGAGGIGLVGGLAITLVLIVGVALAVLAFVGTAVGVGVVVLLLTGIVVLLLSLAFAALGGIYSAALYRYASRGEVPQGFDGAVLAGAFASKG